MPNLITLPSFSDHRGSLTVIEKLLPFSVQRVYWMYNLNENKRGGHRHKITHQALICVNGKCEVVVNTKKEEKIFSLNLPNQCLWLLPEDWHQMQGFEDNAILLVLASHHHDPEDYITEIN